MPFGAYPYQGFEIGKRKDGYGARMGPGGYFGPGSFGGVGGGLGLAFGGLGAVAGLVGAAYGLNSLRLLRGRVPFFY
ncbi:hypothetical protein [Heyndrickxia camelliae]|uniref:Uncharacterized protein n=1 Tax=Heyndrickxia camelliae TaxID=1707093 RepID=A0A2N3LFD1_9BACI|nr:hypothetical protein [Heyndrickxia camelliae]PKR83326.1 hypothetical protein CWO92_19275 [Heyndrickxia camelliae]